SPPSLIDRRPAVWLRRACGGRDQQRSTRLHQNADALVSRPITWRGPGPVRDVRVAPRSRKALVAEDNATVRLLVESVVHSFGFEVTAVSDGAQAQSRIFAERPDLLVLDVLLPTVGGQVLIGTLKAIKRDAKVIAVSGVG